MKKESAHALVTLTLVFAALVVGMLLGRSMQSGDVTMYLSAEATTRPTVTGSHPASSQPTQAAEQITPTHSDKQTVMGRKMNINTATAEELDALPGIGPVIAQRIVDYRRANGTFKDVSELIYVSGVGEKKLDAIIELITVED